MLGTREHAWASYLLWDSADRLAREIRCHFVTTDARLVTPNFAYKLLMCVRSVPWEMPRRKPISLSVHPRTMRASTSRSRDVRSGVVPPLSMG